MPIGDGSIGTDKDQAFARIAQSIKGRRVIGIVTSDVRGVNQRAYTSLDLDRSAKSHQNRWPMDDRTNSTKRTLTANLDQMDDQLATKDQQIEHLQSALDQSQQLQALAESRHQAAHQLLAEMRSRSVLQRLRAVFVAD